MLRKFNAPHLNQGSINFELLDMGSIDNLHGGGKGSTREAYFKDNPNVLNVLLYHKYAHEIVDSEVIVYSEKL